MHGTAESTDSTVVAQSTNDVSNTNEVTTAFVNSEAKEDSVSDKNGSTSHVVELIDDDD